MKAFSLNRWWRLFLFTCLLPSAKAQFVDVTGELEISEWRRPGVTTWPTHFHCVAGTNCWQIDGDFLQNAWMTNWFTGTNLVEYTLVTKGPPEEFVQQMKRSRFGTGTFPAVGSHSSRVSDSMDGNPGRTVRQSDHLTMQGRIAWLAFCSGPCLKRAGHELYPPGDLWKEQVPAKHFTANLVAFPDSLGVPKTLDLTLSNTQPVFQYRVLRSTNVLDWEIPLEFKMIQYCRAPTPQSQWVIAGTNGWEVEFSATGKVTAIGVGAQPQMPADAVRSAQHY